jgi:hypothetical protein
MDQQLVIKKTYLLASQKAGLEMFIGTSSGGSDKAAERAEKYGKNGRVFLRAFEYDKGKETQIIVMLDPSEAYRLAKAIAYVLTNKKAIPAMDPHKFGTPGNETITTVYVDAREVETEPGKPPKVYCGFTITRKKGTENNTHKITVPPYKFEYASHLLKEWSVEAAVNEKIWKTKDQNLSTGGASSQDELPQMDNGDLSQGNPEWDDVPF